MVALRTLPLLGAVVIAALPCGSCSSKRDAQEFELAQIQTAIAAARQTIGDLEHEPVGAKRSAFYAFVSTRFINSVLSALDGAVVHPERMRDGEIHVRSVRADFVAGSPRLLVFAVAKLPATDVTIDLAVDARLSVEPSSQPGELLGRVQLVRVEPKLQRAALDLSTLQSVRKLMSLRANDFAQKLPLVRLPLETHLDLSLPAGARQTAIVTPADGTISVTISYPELTLPIKSRISRILFLRSGLHVFGELEE